ncbi:MAG: hypothetical protein KGL33_10400 [Betaproteobacteria bacterium]|jgi:hypothetical protein|nr:hypothetical protein [Betaproteobacteria bacterium]
MDTGLISSLTALAAVVFAPMVSVYVAKRQIRASVVSVNRQAWINRLRDELAFFVCEVRMVPSTYAANAIKLQEAIKRYEGITLKEEVVKLLLNPTEAEHIELLRLMKTARERAQEAIDNKQGIAKQLDEDADRIVTQSQKVLKAEWDRVKSGE